MYCFLFRQCFGVMSGDNSSFVTTNLFHQNIKLLKPPLTSSNSSSKESMQLQQTDLDIIMPDDSLRSVQIIHINSPTLTNITNHHNVHQNHNHVSTGRIFRPLLNWQLGYRIATSKYFGLLPILVVISVGVFDYSLTIWQTNFILPLITCILSLIFSAPLLTIYDRHLSALLFQRMDFLYIVVIYSWYLITGIISDYYNTNNSDINSYGGMYLW